MAFRRRGGRWASRVTHALVLNSMWKRVFGKQPPAAETPRVPRVLFLDDDPLRAEVFLARRPEAVWVSTVPECLERLAESWDEVHLDHDLGGEVFVDIGRPDCGMEVVRWLCREPRPHLEVSRFVVHSWNEPAACAMALELVCRGYQVELRPFGEEPPPPLRAQGPGRWRRLLDAWRRLTRPGPRRRGGDRPADEESA